MTERSNEPDSVPLITKFAHEFNCLIEKIMTDQRTTQGTIARKLKGIPGASAPSLSNFRKGRRLPSDEVLEAVCDLAGVSPAERNRLQALLRRARADQNVPPAPHPGSRITARQLLFRLRRARRSVRITAGVLTVILATVMVGYCSTRDATVPPLTGKHPDQACVSLHAAGLECDPYDNEITREVNVVHTQSYPAGTRLPKGTAVRYTYESTAPLPLRRYQAPPPNSANVVSPTEPGPAEWIALPPLGWVYAAKETGVPGLVPVFVYRCTGGCAESLVYFLSRDEAAKKNFELEGEVSALT